ncbi:MAG TPA: pilus assembly protein PilZ [Gammaproteobacteria bacterium]|nr:pilus assembly protein PilZ [Gammaproteobacteria bacterium]
MSMNSNGRKMLNLQLKDQESLYKSYLSFLEEGGIFVETREEYQLGDEVFLLVTLPDSEERYPVAGTVVWITPARAAGNRPQGIGVRFGDRDEGKLHNRVEKILAEMIESQIPTYTM